MASASVCNHISFLLETGFLNCFFFLFFNRLRVILVVGRGAAMCQAIAGGDKILMMPLLSIERFLVL